MAIRRQTRRFRSRTNLGFRFKREAPLSEALKDCGTFPQPIHLLHRFRQVIPLIGSKIPAKSPLAHVLQGKYTSSDWNRHVRDWESTTRQSAVRKPERQLGAPWIDNLVAQRMAVSLCADCANRYGTWHIAVGYKKRDRLELSDCDGCRAFGQCGSYYSSLM
jgi:hypothetical protein